VAPLNVRNARPNAASALRSISIEGFKSIGERRELLLGTLNVLAGANSSGKSSFMQPLLLLKQTLEASFDPGPLLLDGPNVRFSELNQIFSLLAKTREFSIGLFFEREQSLEFRFAQGDDGRLHVKENIFSSEKVPLRITESSSDAELEEIKARLPRSFPFIENGRLEVVRDRAFLRVLVEAEGRKIDVTPYIFNFDHGAARELGHNIVHVPGLRGQPDRRYKNTAVASGSFPGTLDNYVASIIADWQEKKDPRLATLSRQLQFLGLTWTVKAKKIDATSVELKVGRLPRARRGGASDLVSIADVGFGVSQVLPVLVALLVAQPGQLVYIEQPETHLHPKAQRALASIFAEAIAREAIIVVETHSLLFVRAIQTLVAKRSVAPDKVKLHWIQRDAQGDTQIATCELDPAGAYGDWPQDFDATELEAEREYIEAAEAVILGS